MHRDTTDELCGWVIIVIAALAVVICRFLCMRRVYAECGHLAYLRPDGKGSYEQRLTLRITANEKKKIALKTNSGGVPKYCYRCYAQSQGWGMMTP